METFELRKSCNDLLLELNKREGKQNIIKLGIDIQLPDIYAGNPEDLIASLRDVTKFIGSSLVNGIINIEIGSQSRNELTVGINTLFMGSGTHRMKGADVENFVRKFNGSLKYQVKKDRLIFNLSHFLQLHKSDEQGTELPFHNRHILLAEDNEINAMVFSSFLEEWGCENTTAINGAEAISLAHDKEFDAILMDIFMPVLNGHEATRKIREFNPHVPIIALTASTQAEDIKGILDAGANDYLLKPVSSAQLFQVLSKYL